MAKAYTPGLLVTRHKKHRIMRRLPIAGDVQVSVGDAVTADDIVAILFERAILLDKLVRRNDKIDVLDGKVADLYDLHEDPGEENNLIHSSKPDHVAARERLSAVVETFPKVDGRRRYDVLPPQPWDITREANEKMWNRQRRSSN